MAIIKVMDDILANKIAAGEVVEKCSSVVKELVENSIDAKADEIKIELIDSGTRSIIVIDNGVGMDKDDAILCFNRHATSKLKTEDDLFNIKTLGFRGEALASIASVSKVTLQTCQKNIGTEIKIDGGKIINVKTSTAREGTKVQIDNLFYNTPARLKHLKSLYTELSSITDYINKIALSYPTIKFTLINNGNTLLNTDGSGNLLKVIHAIYGLNITKKMVFVSGSNNDYEIDGYISLPEIHRSNRNGMVTLVNGRVVRNTELNHFINECYHSYKPDNRYPIIVLNIKTDPTLIDVNIHPTKMDVKFSKMEELLDLIKKIILEKLKTKTLIPHIEVETDNIETSDIKKTKYQEQTLFLERVNEEEIPYSTNNKDYKSKNDSSDFILLDNNDSLNSKTNDEKKERMPELYPVGLVHGTYIICQNEKGMYLIDQHAAKERINYEYYKKKLGSPKKGSTSLLFPITIEFSNNEFIILKERFELLSEMNFEIEEFGVNSVIIKKHPTWLPKGYENDAIRRILEIIIKLDKNFSIEKFNEKVATMMSCKLAIKANMNITLEEMESLINDLRECENPFNCPHGRPTMIYYTKYDLEKMFKRSGF